MLIDILIVFCLLLWSHMWSHILNLDIFSTYHLNWFINFYWLLLSVWYIVIEYSIYVGSFSWVNLQTLFNQLFNIFIHRIW